MAENLTAEIDEAWEGWSRGGSVAPINGMHEEQRAALGNYGIGKYYNWHEHFSDKCFNSLTDYITPAEAAVFHFAGSLSRLLFASTGAMYKFALAYALSLPRSRDHDYLSHFVHSLTIANQLFDNWGGEEFVYQERGSWKGRYEFAGNHREMMIAIDNGLSVRPTQCQVSNLATSLDHTSPWMHRKDCFRRPSSEIEVRSKWQSRYVAPAFEWGMMQAMAFPFSRQLSKTSRSFHATQPLSWFGEALERWVKIRRRLINQAVSDNKDVRSVIHSLPFQVSAIMLKPIGFLNKESFARVVCNKLSSGVLPHRTKFDRKDYAALGFFIPVEEHLFDRLKQHHTQYVYQWVAEEGA